MPRYLTPQQKEKEIVDLLANENMEVELWPFLWRLNRIKGVCTLSSCGGHQKDEYKTDGHLFLWLSKAFSETFKLRAFGLLAYEPILSVRTTYGGFGREETEVWFLGRAHQRMQESLDIIVGFFERIAEEA